ncbi:MAG: beta-galactosidase GalB [Bacteroidales bacterium]
MYLILTQKNALEVIMRIIYSCNAFSFSIAKSINSFGLLIVFACFPALSQVQLSGYNSVDRERISLNNGWRFFKYDSLSKADHLIYDDRPEVDDMHENRVADAKPTEAVAVQMTQKVLKPWILPSGNDFIKDPAKRYIRPEGNPGCDFSFVQHDFNDNTWEVVDLPHDWAIKGPFYEGWDAEVSGGMGRLPIHGVAWYRKKIDFPLSDKGKSVFLEIDGAMSYAMVWINGHLAGGWPYGYNSWQLDLTPYLIPGGENQLSIRLDNPNHSARWYPGGGIYRNVWLIKTHPVHVAQWGTFITTGNVSAKSATVNLEVNINNDSKETVNVEIITRVYALGKKQEKAGKAIAVFSPLKTTIIAEESSTVAGSVLFKNPELWGPPPTQTPHLYMAVTSLYLEGKVVDTYETQFGIRSLKFDPDKGIFVNGERIPVKGVNQHHDLGALGAAFNTRAAERQLEILQEMGCNAIRMAHNPPAPELLELTDRMGFLVMDEVFDSWERKKTPHDFHLIFPDWYEQDLRAMIRRDRNHPSVIIWSFGNEVGEQYTGDDGAAIAKKLHLIVKDEDTTRPTTAAMNFAKPDMVLPKEMDVISLNYQGEGIRQSPEFEGTERIRTPPQYLPFHEKFPDKVVLTSESASAASSRGIYLFPVTPDNSSSIGDGRGGNSTIAHVSSYEIYAVDFGSSAEKVFGSIERHPFVAGEFVWNGWDYLGEPTPYYSARSSYTGIIDLAGFKKDRFYLYQSHWRPDLPMVHMLPHWNWPERIGEITPVHIFTSGDEAEVFLNGKSLGRKKKGEHEYRLRWDSVRYEPGEVKAIAYKNGIKWAEEMIETTGKPSNIMLIADRTIVDADGKDMAFITVKVVDDKGRIVPDSDNLIEFSVEGPGEIVATDNGDPTDLTPFPSLSRKVFNGLALVFVRSVNGEKGSIIISAKSAGLSDASVAITSK